MRIIEAKVVLGAPPPNGFDEIVRGMARSRGLEVMEIYPLPDGLWIKVVGQLANDEEFRKTSRALLLAIETEFAVASRKSGRPMALEHGVATNPVFSARHAKLLAGWLLAMVVLGTLGQFVFQHLPAKLQDNATRWAALAFNIALVAVAVGGALSLRRRIAELATLRRAFSEKDDQLKEAEAAAAGPSALVALAQRRLLFDVATTHKQLTILQRASLFVFWPGILLLCLGAICGGGLVAWTTYNQLDWHYLLSGVSLSFIGFAAGSALLRHDFKLREQYAAHAADAAVVERLHLAIRFAEAVGDPTFLRDARQGVLQRLVALGDAPRASSAPAPSDPDPGLTQVEAIKAVSDAVTAVATPKAQ